MIRLAILCAIAGLVSATAWADQKSQLDDKSMSAAIDFLNASGYDERSAQYSDMWAHALIKMSHQQQPLGVGSVPSNDCAKAMPEFSADDQEQVKLAIARIYASRFTGEELSELTAFERSELGHEYNRATFELVRDVAQRPGNAVPLARGVVGMVNSGARSYRLTIILQGLKGRITERDIGRLSTFFYNGVGEKLLAVNLEVDQAILGLEGARFKELVEQLKEGHCS